MEDNTTNLNNLLIKLSQNIMMLKGVKYMSREILDTIIKTIARNSYDYISGGLDHMGYGFVTGLKEEFGDMASIKTYDGNYEIALDRYNRQLWINNETGQFLCTIKIYDSLHREILSVNFSEYFAFHLLDVLYQYDEFSMRDLVIPIETGSTNMASYQFNLHRNDIDPLVIDFSILQYDSINESLMPRIVTQLSDEILNNLMFGIYFSFLIDIDTGDISLMENIYSKLIE